MERCAASLYASRRPTHVVRVCHFLSGRTVLAAARSSPQALKRQRTPLTKLEDYDVTNVTASDLLQIAGVSGLISSIFFSIFAKAWRPYFAAYLGKKGERLANAEDIEKILREVRLVTAETEAVKAQISGGIWEKRTLWSKRVEVYSELFDSMVQYGTAVNEASAKWQSAQGRDELAQRAAAAFENLTVQQVRVIANQSRARLFAGSKLDAHLSALFDVMGVNEGSLRDPSSFQELFAPLMGKMLAEMRREIEFPPN
jgi:hypothetical protein